jgi:hypothetical protein
MFAKAGLALLFLWVVGLVSLDVGSGFHILLLVGLMLLMLGLLKARNAALDQEAAERRRNQPPPTR